MSSFWYDPIVGNTGGSGLQTPTTVRRRPTTGTRSRPTRWRRRTHSTHGPIAPVVSGGRPITTRTRGRLRSIGADRLHAAKAAAAGQNPLGPDPWSGTGFDPVKYLQSNPDVAAAGVDPWTHVQQHGYTEGREGAGGTPRSIYSRTQTWLPPEWTRGFTRGGLVFLRGVLVWRVCRPRRISMAHFRRLAFTSTSWTTSRRLMPSTAQHFLFKLRLATMYSVRR